MCDFSRHPVVEIRDFIFENSKIFDNFTVRSITKFHANSSVKIVGIGRYVYSKIIVRRFTNSLCQYQKYTFRIFISAYGRYHFFFSFFFLWNQKQNFCCSAA